MSRVFAVGRGMLAMRPNVGVSSSSLVAGHTLRLDSGQKAAVLCWRGGLCFAALPPGAEVAGECDATHEPGKAFSLPVGDTLGGRIIDCLGSPLDGGPALRADAPQWPLFGPVPEASALKPINRSLHTGTTAIDALTPLGRGQSLLLIGQARSGAAELGWDAVLAQARHPDVHAVLGLTRGGAARGAAALAQLREHGMCGRATVVATREADGASAAERALVAAGACAVAEQRRAAGGHALVLLDDFSGVLDVWDEAGEAVTRHGPAYTGASERHIERSEQRIFYATYLQRVAQMDEARGGGSLTLIAMLQQPSPPDADSHATFGTVAPGPAPAGPAAVRDPPSSSSPSFALEAFASHPATERARIAALLQRGVRIDDDVLRRLAIRPPAAAAAADANPDANANADADADADAEGGDCHAAHARSMRHIDQLTSLADGHVQLHAELKAAGRSPALEPAECIARVGAGTDTATRPQPSTPAMRAVAANLRLELVLARDQLPGAADPYSVQQRRRAAAYHAVLCSQPAGAPLRLAQQIALLLALADGKLDGLGDAPPAEAARAVLALLERLGTAAPNTLVAVDATGELADDARAELRAAVEALPGASVGRRAFFGTWDSVTPDAEGSLAALARGKLE